MSAPFDPSKFNLDITASSQDTQTDPLISWKQENWEVKQEEIISEDILSEISSDIPDKPALSGNILDEIEIIPEVKNSTEKKQDDIKQIIDINISSLEDIILYLQDKKYDFVTLEPEEIQIKITFRQDNVEREIKYIKFPVYTNILFKTKQITKLMLEDTGSSQEWKWTIKIWSDSFELISKIATGQNGEKIFLKSKKIIVSNTKKQTEKTPIWKILGFLGAILFIALILFGVFIGFIVFNASDVQDVAFFRSLGINLNEINIFIETMVNIVFSILLFIVTVALSFSLFKFLTTKKQYKRKKVVYWILSWFLLLIMIWTGTAWMSIYGKIQSLPNWLEKERGNLQIFDNTLLISDDFSDSDAYLENIENLIAPITLKFDLSNFENDRSNQIYNIKKYIWDFGDERVETFSPEIIQSFNNIWNYETIITVEWENSQWEPITQIISNTATISISHKIEIVEDMTTNGGKRLQFDAQNLENLWEVAWYIYEPSTKTNPNPSYAAWTRVADGYQFIPRKIFFDEAYIGLAIISGNKTDETLDKIIRINSKGVSEIAGKISFKQSLENELQFDFFVEEPSTGFANGFIESYQWSIEDKTYNTAGDMNEGLNSPSITHQFTNFWDQLIQVTLTDSTGQSETISKNITIQKQLDLKSFMNITNNGAEIENLKYEKNTHEYFIDNLGIPTVLKFDARYVRAENSLYALSSIEWDIWDDGDKDADTKTFEYLIPTEWNHTIAANYIFKHRRDDTDVISIKEYVYIQWVKKEAILDIKLEYPSNYVPVNVRFDASASFIKNDDIIKFEYDYGDGIVEERDAINPGHRYTKAWDYIIKLTVTGKSWKKYSTEKSLILLPIPQEVKITSSMKQSQTWQGIDFSSAESSGQIIEYFWDFWDGNISTDANPTHSFTKPGIYEVTLKAEFINSNSIQDLIEIEIIDTK